MKKLAPFHAGVCFGLPRSQNVKRIRKAARWQLEAPNVTSSVTIGESPHAFLVRKQEPTAGLEDLRASVEDDFNSRVREHKTYQRMGGWQRRRGEAKLYQWTGGMKPSIDSRSAKKNIAATSKWLRR